MSIVNQPTSTILCLDDVLDRLRRYHIKLGLHEPEALEENISWYRDLFDLVPEQSRLDMLSIMIEEPSHIDMYFLTIDLCLNLNKETK